MLARVVAELDDIAGIDETGARKDGKPARILRLSGVGDDERHADGDESGGDPGDGRDLASEREKQKWHEHGGRDAAERAGGDVEVAQALDVADVQHEVEHAEHDAMADEVQAVCAQGGDDAFVEHEQQQGCADKRGNARGSERRDAVRDGGEDDGLRRPAERDAQKSQVRLEPVHLAAGAAGDGGQLVAHKVITSV